MNSSKYRLQVDISAYILATMVFFWLCMNGLGGWRTTLEVQTGLVFVIALTWSVMSLSFVAILRWLAKREVAKYADEVMRSVRDAE